MEIVNELFPTGKFRNIDTTFWVESTYEKKLIPTVIFTGNVPQKEEMEYHDKFGHNIGRIQHIVIMKQIDIYYTAYHLGTQTVAPNLPYFQGLKICIQFLCSKL